MTFVSALRQSSVPTSHAPLASLAAASTASLLVFGSFYALWIAPWLSGLLKTAHGHQGTSYGLVCHAITLGVITCLALPGQILGAIVARRVSLRAGRVVGACSVLLVVFFLACDQYLYQSFGRHLSGLLDYVDLPERHQAVGNGLFWVTRTAGCAAFGVLSFVAFWFTSQLAERFFTHLSRKALLSVVSAVGLIQIACLASIWLMVPLLPEGIAPRLMASLPIQLESARGFSSRRTGPMGALEANLRDEYRTRFAHVFAPPTPHSVAAPASGMRRPNISLVVAESLRYDIFTPQYMPELYSWSTSGLRLDRHYAGSNYSETGLFNLVYGRSSLTYHTTLNTRVPPTLCKTFRELGYRCGYFTGHPKVWLRREEFMNDETFDDFVHDDRGDWNEWDKRALARAAEYLKGDAPSVAVTFLMSSHYEYRYPPQFERHRPAEPPRVAFFPGQAKPEEFESNRNRYLNVAGFIDHIVMDHVRNLDEQNTWIVFTSDHGEATGESGRYGHGFDFSDTLTHVPFVMKGPGIPRGVGKRLTCHQDLLPTLLAGLDRPLSSGGAGQSLLTPRAREVLLQVHPDASARLADALLLADDLRLRLRLDLREAELDVIGFEDEHGQPLELVPTEAQIETLRRDFADQLERAGASFP